MRITLDDDGWQVRICRPAFRDFRSIFPRYYARSVLNRQSLKLRWWNPNELFVVDLQWNPLAETGLFELLIEPGGELPAGVRVFFFVHSPNPSLYTLWVLGGVRVDEEFQERQKLVFYGRSVIVKERAD